MAEAAKVCGATGFMMWCQCVAGLYLQASGNPGLTGERWHAMCAAKRWAAPAVQPDEELCADRALLLKATPVDGGYVVNGTLPWVSNLAPDHYFGAIAAVPTDGAAAAR
jgi:alkylation response protein AidB-like acyl-CoA dehydrogenase